MVTSITAEVRDELIQVRSSHTGCRQAQLSTMLRMTAELRVRRGLALVADVDRAAVARYLRREITTLHGASANANVIGRNNYQVRVEQGTLEMARAAGLIDGRNNEVVGLPAAVVGGSPSEIAAAWRGAFLVAGSLNGVGRNASLEVRCPSPESAYALASCARRMGVVALVRDSRGTDTVVVRESESIATLLSAMGAVNSLAEWQRRGVRQRLQQWGTIDAANARRTATAAAETCMKVERALTLLGDDAPEHLAETGKLRLRYRDASLEELGRYANPPRSKDSVAGKLRRLLALADKFAEVDETEQVEDRSGELVLAGARV